MPPERAQLDGMDQLLEDQPLEFRKKDGTFSKMRSHRGNVPVLPQTHLCPECPAKFTRTTHLNRHRRTHSSNRPFACDTCSSQFTRSDLLARHKKRCSPDQDATRRKSCVACTEAKIKCDRQSPCAKCQSRGKECLFAPTDKPTAKSTPEPTCASDTVRPINDANPTLDPVANICASPGAQILNIPGSSSGTTHSDLILAQYGASSWWHGSSPSTLMMVPPVDDLSPNTFASAYDNELFQPFFDGILAGGSPGFHDGSSMSSDGSSPEHSLLSNGVHSFFSSFGMVPDSAQDQYKTDLPGVQPALSDIRSSNSSPSVCVDRDSMSPECQHYMYFFFAAFLPQMPVVHAPTFTVEGKPPLLLRAMQACGALYVKTRKAALFIEQTLTSTRETLISEFSNPRDATAQLHLITAVILLQTIGLFYQKAEQRVQSTIYHGMLVQMIRRSGLIPRNASWQPKLTEEYLDVEEAWRDWAMFEMTKRLLTLSFLHDTCHAIHLATAPSYRLTEYLAGLPGETSLWRAQSAEEWYMLLQIPNSPYGPTTARLVGPNLRRCLDAITESQLLTQPTPATPFGHFVLVHALLRILFDVCVESRLPTSGNTSDPAAVEKEIYKIQFGLHNWLQSWLASPELSQVGSEPAFVDNALPFYWFGQVALLAYQEELPPFEPGSPNNQTEDRFHLVKTWFRHIRDFLNSSDQGATMIWNELIKIRLQTWQGRENNVDDSEGVLSFFES